MSPSASGSTEVAQLASDLDGDGRLGQSRPDRLGGVEPGGAVDELDRGAVGKVHLHGRGAYKATPHWYARCVQAVTVTLALALVAVSAIAVRIAIDRAGRRPSIEADQRLTVPQSELSVALASREALFLAAPGPVLMYAADGRLVRANALAREQSLLMSDPPTAGAGRGRRARSWPATRPRPSS